MRHTELVMRFKRLEVNSQFIEAFLLKTIYVEMVSSLSKKTSAPPIPLKKRGLGRGELRWNICKKYLKKLIGNNRPIQSLTRGPDLNIDT